LTKSQWSRLSDPGIEEGRNVLAQVRGATLEVEAVLASLDPDVLDGSLAAEYVEVFARLERLAAAGKTLTARRVVATRSWSTTEGAHRDATSWMASVSGSTVTQAASVLDTAAKVAELAATEASMRSGVLSPTQAALVADAATADPHSEHELLERAEVDGVRGLRGRCAAVKAAARTDEIAHHQRIHATRSLRSFTDGDGAGRIEIRGTADDTARLLAALEPYERELFATARSSSECVRADAIAFDALLAMAHAARSESTVPGGNGSAQVASSGPSASISVRIDHSALRRGHTESGEVCEIVGTGPVPVAVVSQMLDDAFVRALEVDGTEVLTVSHIGRLIPARLRTAVEDCQRECAIAGCHVDRHLEIDHNLPIEAGGPTALWNLNRLCHHHHRHKHEHDLRLTGAGTDLRFVGADTWTRPDRR
jgi:hypothetical protein